LCIKFNSSLIEGEKKEASYKSKISNQIKKNDFIIWRFEDGSMRVEETNTFLKPIPIDASPPKAGVAIFEIASSLCSYELQCKN
jgi:hypothetical protein